MATKVSKKIRDLFYSPRTDSIRSLLKDIKTTHAKILKNTDFSKGTLPAESRDHKSLLEEFSIPLEGLPKGEFADTIADLFKGAPRWHSAHAMYNVAPPPLLPTIVGAALASLYNPNLVLGTTAGMSAVAEQRVVKAIAEYIGWDWHQSRGSFTFGGKATSMYGIKLGLKKCCKDSSTLGVKEDIVVLSTKACHPCHVSDAEWLGVGSKNVVRLNTDSSSRVDLGEMESVIEETVKRGRKIATIIISGGTTNSMAVDPIKEVVELRDRLVQKLGLDYKPHVHVDTVVGFPWIFFKDYDMKENSLHISPQVRKKISKIVSDLENLKCADSFGIDFHKMGFCPYISSLFMVKESKFFSNDKESFTELGEYSPFVHTIENSRPGSGPISAYIALNVLGVRGFQTLIAHLTEVATHLQDTLEKTGQFEIVSKTGLGNSVVFVPIVPKHIVFKKSEEETVVRDAYTTTFLNTLRKMGNPFFIDMIPSYSTGTTAYPYKALKTYMMSPHTDKKTGSEFVRLMLDLKTKIDATFDFSCVEKEDQSPKYLHPLK